MQAWMLDYLACPACRAERLVVERRDRVSTLDLDGGSQELLVTGVLICDQCKLRYPVLQEAPRLVPDELLTEDERAILERRPPQATSRGPARQLSKEQQEARLRELILTNYGCPTKGSGLRRALSEFDYQRTYADRRVYQMEILQDLLERPPRVVLDVGGGNGGNLRAAGRVFPLQRGIVADLSPDQASFFQTGDRRLGYVRADATGLPFRSESFDLVISTFLIEHVAAWTDVVDELARVGEVAFVVFGPNVRFPVEIGHLDAPLAHCLPAPLGPSAAYLWGLLTNNRRSYKGIVAILRDMNYISSSRYYTYCRQKGYAHSNLFPSVVEALAHNSRSGLRGWLGRHRSLARLAARSLVRMGAEPNVYSLLKDSPGARGSGAERLSAAAG